MITIIGDDLTGTAEAAAVFHRYGREARIGLDAGASPGPGADARELGVAELRAAGTDVITVQRLES